MADTSRINMGRRIMPRCEGEGCLRRCETSAGGLCRLCAIGILPRPRMRKTLYRAPVAIDHQPVARDISADEIERRYQAARREQRYRRAVAC